MQISSLAIHVQLVLRSVSAMPSSCTYTAVSALRRHGSISLHWFVWQDTDCLKFLRVSVQHQQLRHTFHTFPFHHLNYNERWRSTGFSYTRKIKLLHVYREALRHVDLTGVKGSSKATQAGLAGSSCPVKAVTASTDRCCMCVGM